MKEQTFLNIFPDEPVVNNVEDGFDVDLNTEDLVNKDKELSIKIDQSAELEEVDFNDQFEMSSFNEIMVPQLDEQLNQDVVEQITQTLIASEQEEQIQIMAQQNIEPQIEEEIDFQSIVNQVLEQNLDKSTQQATITASYDEFEVMVKDNVMQDIDGFEPTVNQVDDFNSLNQEENNQPMPNLKFDTADLTTNTTTDDLELKMEQATVQIDTQELDSIVEQQASINQTSINIDMTHDDFSTLDTTQFSQELGDIKLVGMDQEEVIQIQTSYEDFHKKNDDYGQLRILAIGVGGCGCNFIHSITNQTVDEINTLALDTDETRLANINADEKLLIGSSILNGNGSGGDTDKVRDSFRDAHDKLAQKIKDYHMVFLIGALDGGTGGPGLIEVGHITKELDVLSIAFTISPLRGAASTKRLNEVYNNLKLAVDSTILINSELIVQAIEDLTTTQMQQRVDKTLLDGISGVYDTAMKTGIINLDYADIRTAFKNRGSAVMAIGYGSGENNIIDAITNALKSDVIDQNIITNLDMAIIAISAPEETVKIAKASEASNLVFNLSNGNNPLILFGWNISETVGSEVKATVVISTDNDYQIPEYSLTYDKEDDDAFEEILKKINLDYDHLKDHKNHRPATTNTNQSGVKLQDDTQEIKTHNTAKLDDDVVVVMQNEESKEYPNFFD